MKSFITLSRSQRILCLVATFVVLFSYQYSHQEDAPATPESFPGLDTVAYQLPGQPQVAGYAQPTSTNPSVGGTTSGPGQKVVVYDQGLQMPRGSYIMPSGWQVIQDIATNPANGQPSKYKLDFVGPRGELVRALGIVQYSPVIGTQFEQTWRQSAQAGLQGELSQVVIGNLKPSEAMQRNKFAKKYAQMAAQQGAQIQYLEATIDGNRNGQPYRGVVRLAHINSATNPELGGMITASFIISPAGQLPQTLSISEQIDNSLEINPAFEQRIQQINQQVARRMTTDHQQRMAQRQASFNAHQQRMRDMSQAQDASFNSYMERSQSSYPSAWSNSSYTGQDATVDMIHGRSTYENPDTGNNISIDGQYDYMYTDGMGNYYGTNDANFNPASLQGNWQQTQELTPNY